MTPHFAILDFDEDDKAIVEVPDALRNYSLVVEHWQDPHIQLEEIEADLLCVDSSARKNFLDKARSVLRECLECGESSPSETEDDWLLNVELSDEEQERIMSLHKDLNLDESSHWPFDVEESEEEKEFNSRSLNENVHLESGYDEEYANPQYLRIYNYRLKHSLVWYLMGRVEREITMVEREIEKNYGYLKIHDGDNFEKFITICRKSNSPFAAMTSIVQEFQLSSKATEQLLGTTMRDLAAVSTAFCQEQIRFFEAIKVVLQKFR